MKGLNIDWTRLYGQQLPAKLCLPGYPFAKERYWIDAPEEVRGYRKAGEANVLQNIHPLLHSNTSDFSQQRFTSVFSGDEFFLRDHLIHSPSGAPQKVLPAVAYLEMSRMAIVQSAGELPEDYALEMHNMVWAQPIVVDDLQEVNIELDLDDNGEIEFEVFTAIDSEEDTVHYQGKAVFTSGISGETLDLGKLRGKMGRGVVGDAQAYDILTRMGLIYGPAHQGIKNIYLGEREVLAELRLPAVIQESQGDYVLNPSLMDSALQASIGLFEDLVNIPKNPSIPFALDAIRILAPCTRDMVAWVRYAQGSEPGDSITRLDVDLCDAEGRVCIQIQGFTDRALESDIGAAQAGVPSTMNQGASFDDAFYESVIDNILENDMSVDDAVELG